MVRTRQAGYAFGRVSAGRHSGVFQRLPIRLRLAAGLCLAGLLLTPPSSAAPSAENAHAAREAFSHGSEAFKAGDFEQAAQSFDRAYELAPHYAALWNAAQAWERAGEGATAANRYVRYLNEAPEADADRPKAQAALRALSKQLGRLKIQAEGGGSVSLDGVAVLGDEVYVEPGQHVVQLERDEDSQRRVVEVRAGETQSVVLREEPSTPPQPAPPVASATPAASVAPKAPLQSAVPERAPPQADQTSRQSGLPPLVTWIGVGVTTLLGAATVWSGLDTQAARRDFDQSPTAEGLEAGQSKQDRTNILFAATLGAGLVTGGVALFFTDWSGEQTGAGHARGFVFGMRGVF